MVIELPSILNIPTKLIPIITDFDKYRYFILEGGRGGGKSHSIGRWILYLAEKYDLRIVCGRETQNSISESVHSLLSDLILSFNLNFEVLDTKITHRESGSTINFRGFRKQGALNIQGMEGVDIVWIDESQALQKETIDKLIPTIRKDNAKIIFTMNRHVHNDPAYAQFVGRDDCLHIKINFDENPYCTNALKKEASECQKKSESDYRHIWLGEPLTQSEDAVFGHDELQASKKAVYPLRPGYDYRIAGFDIARYGDDKCACVVLQQMGALHWETVLVEQWDHKDLNYTTGRILMLSNEQRANRSIIDEDGIGAGPLDTLNKGRGLNNFTGFRNPALSYKEDRFFGNNRTANAYKLKELILKGHIRITDDELLAELETLRYTFDHNQRRILISKEKMKKEGVKSPNLADALIMAVSLIGDVQQEQNVQYRPRYNQSQNDNLFAIAGVR